MGLAVGLGVGVGLLLVWLAVSSPREPGPPPRSRVRELLDRAGLAGTSVGGLATVCAVCGLVSFVGVQLLSRTATVALAFALLSAYLPVAVVAGRARRRQRELAEVWPVGQDLGELALTTAGPAGDHWAGRPRAARTQAPPSRCARAAGRQRRRPGRTRRRPSPGHPPRCHRRGQARTLLRGGGPGSRGDETARHRQEQSHPRPRARPRVPSALGPEKVAEVNAEPLEVLEPRRHAVHSLESVVPAERTRARSR